MSNYEPYRFLREMKEQHELNEKALNFLRARLIYHNRYLLIYSKKEFIKFLFLFNSVLPVISDVPSLPYISTRYTQLRPTGGSNSIR